MSMMSSCQVWYLVQGLRDSHKKFVTSRGKRLSSLPYPVNAATGSHEVEGLFSLSELPMLLSVSSLKFSYPSNFTIYNPKKSKSM